MSGEAGRISEVADGVFWVRGPLVNWYLLREDRELTLVDTGYPGDGDDVVASINHLARGPADLRAVVITHAHADHIGAAARVQSTFAAPVLVGSGDLNALRSGALDQVRLPAVLVRSWRPRMARWAVGAVRRGGRHAAAVPDAQALPARPAGVALDLPGRPVPVPTGGHTPGHTMLHLPDSGVLLTGDALVTGHPVSRGAGPQLLADLFHADGVETRSSLSRLSGLEADLILPGHGGPHRGPLDEAVAQALQSNRVP